MSTTVYLFDPSVTNLKTHILTNGVASIGDNSYNITSTNILNINFETNILRKKLY